jgi:hypothetical protein
MVTSGITWPRGKKVYAEDRVLVGIMSNPRDFQIARDQGWYRVPARRAERGVYFEYVAFYFTAAFGDEKWAIHYYARRLGHELVTRRDLLPDEPDHPRADEPYYKIQLGPLQKRERPIASRRWRRITFIYTTWDRFQVAEEINDLYAQGGEYVDRLYVALRDAGLTPERHYPVREKGLDYTADLAVPCRAEVLTLGVSSEEGDAPNTLFFTPHAATTESATCLRLIRAEIERRGGLLPLAEAVNSEEENSA